MRRRNFIALVGCAGAWPRALHAQQVASVPLVGFLRSTPAEPFVNLVAAFREGLAEGGYQEGRNIDVLYRFADNDIARLSTLASDLVGRRVAVIVGNAAAVQAVKARESRDRVAPVPAPIGTQSPLLHAMVR